MNLTTDGFVVVWLLLIPLAIGGAIWFQAQRAKRLRAWAASAGWTYVGADPSLVARWRGEPFGRGHSQRATEVMTGRFQGRPALSFAYSYTTGSGKDRHTYTFHVVAVALPAYLPTLELTPDGLGAKLAKTFGGQDIQFESEDFNRAWRIEARDLKFAHDVVHPRLMERLLRPDARGTSLRIEGSDAVSWTQGSTRTETLAARLSVLCALVDAVPRFVWLDHGHDPGPDLGRGARPGPGAPGAWPT